MICSCFCQQKTAYEMLRSLVGSDMCIRDSPWAAFAIIPVFALANAGVSFREAGEGGLVNATSMGGVGGLLMGKVLGVAGLAWVLVRSGLAELPEGLTWRHIIGLGFLAGVGFTMSLFIAQLAFGDSALLAPSKIGILAGSVLSGAIGVAVLRAAEARRGRLA